ncbi:MAG: DUF1570 domain-containing protein [Planctomycetales bacterium]|nr:DUF1570 domain-containing protein [Planctomycetales bacterium]
MNKLKLSALLLLLASLCRCSYAQEAKLMRVDVAGKSLLGLPIHWGSHDAAILEPKGRIHILNLQDVQSHEILQTDFVPQSLIKARLELNASLGAQYETIIFGPYVLAAPRGQTARWRDRFNALLAGYVRYFQLRGWQLQSPDFPLCVIIYGSREEFLQHAARENMRIPPNVVGSYFPESNQCVLYQIPDHQGTNWSETEATIVHEAVHQLAYNTGLHERLFTNPLWCVEGLACMFEVPAVYDARLSGSTQTDRMSNMRLNGLKRLLGSSLELESLLTHLIASDDFFRQQPETAYSLAWALTFYLSEKMPREYAQLLAMQKKRGFGQYTSAERQADFGEAIRIPPGMLAVQLQRLFSRQSK